MRAHRPCTEAEPNYARDAAYMVRSDVMISERMGITPSREMVEQAEQLVALMRRSPVVRNTMIMRHFLGAHYRYEVYIATGRVTIQQTGERWSRYFYPRDGHESKQLSLNTAEFLEQLHNLQ